MWGATYILMLKNAFKKHPLQNRTNVQIKGGGGNPLNGRIPLKRKWQVPLSSGLSPPSPSPLTGIWVSFIDIDAFNLSCCNLYIVVRGRLGLFALVNMTFGHSSDCFVFPMFDCGRGESGTCPSVPANVASLSPARLTDHCYPPTSSSSQKSAINIAIAVSIPRSWYDVHIN